MLHKKVTRFLFLLFFLPVICQAQFSLDDTIKEIEFQDDTIKAVFVYVASNILYDTEFKDSTPEYHSYNEVLNEVLQKKKGVCMHYAALFHAICTRLGFESYIISGYTKFLSRPAGKLPHTWNAVKINGKWFFFDPTWASGYIVGTTFLPYYDETWFKQTPEEFIYSHIPFDPIWQFRDRVSTHEEIKKNDYRGSTFMLSNHYTILLKEYNEANELKQLELSLNRIKEAGIANELIKNKVNFIEEQIAIHYHNQQVYALKNGIDLLNAARVEFHQYLEAKQRLFKQWSDNQISSSLQSLSEKAREAERHIVSTKVIDHRIQPHVNKNMLHAREMLLNIEEEKQFVQKYLNTWKPIRFIKFL